LKRQHQCATIQLDFQLPIRFNLKYRTQAATSGEAEAEEAGAEEAGDGGDASAPASAAAAPAPGSAKKDKKGGKKDDKAAGPSSAAAEEAAVKAQNQDAVAAALSRVQVCGRRSPPVWLTWHYYC
jgi:hypothetical protein